MKRCTVGVGQPLLPQWERHVAGAAQPLRRRGGVEYDNQESIYCRSEQLALFLQKLKARNTYIQQRVLKEACPNIIVQKLQRYIGRNWNLVALSLGLGSIWITVTGNTCTRWAVSSRCCATEYRELCLHPQFRKSSPRAAWLSHGFYQQVGQWHWLQHGSCVRTSNQCICCVTAS